MAGFFIHVDIDTTLWYSVVVKFSDYMKRGIIYLPTSGLNFGHTVTVVERRKTDDTVTIVPDGYKKSIVVPSGHVHEMNEHGSVVVNPTFVSERSVQ